MNDKELKEIAMSNFLKNKADEIGRYMVNNKIENAHAVSGLAWLIAYVIEPPKGTNKMFAELFEKLLFNMLNKLYEQ